jgi:diketogulonate reductase-like aldo/keto reductase
MSASPVRTTSLPGGADMPVLGLGTWRMGEKKGGRRAEADALCLGLDLGMGLIDTAEMYGEGGAEQVVGDAIAGRRDAVFLVSKLYPQNATRAGTLEACERSLKRLRTDRIDLYLLHWRGGARLPVVVEAFGRLVEAGKIRHWGVSNFDQSDMAELVTLPGGKSVAANQVLYNLKRRGIEFDLMPWCRTHKIPMMAYSPVDQGGLVAHPVLAAIGKRHGATPAQIAIAWLLRQPGVIVIPKASSPQHVRENRAAADVALTAADLQEIDKAFPPPRGAAPLEML